MLKRIRERFRETSKESKPDSSRKPISLQSLVSLETLKKLKIAYIPYNELLKEGFFAGLGWAAGVSVGFVIVSTVIVFILQLLGGVPFIGGFFADIIHATLQQLSKRTPLFSQ